MFASLFCLAVISFAQGQTCLSLLLVEIICSLYDLAACSSPVSEQILPLASDLIDVIAVLYLSPSEKDVSNSPLRTIYTSLSHSLTVISLCKRDIPTSATDTTFSAGRVGLIAHVYLHIHCPLHSLVVLEYWLKCILTHLSKRNL